MQKIVELGTNGVWTGLASQIEKSAGVPDRWIQVDDFPTLNLDEYLISAGAGKYEIRSGARPPSISKDGSEGALKVVDVYNIPKYIYSGEVIEKADNRVIVIVGNSEVAAPIQEAITLKNLNNCIVLFFGLLDCKQNATVGVKLDKVTNTRVFGIRVANAYADPESGSATGIRIVNGCVNSDIGFFSVTNTVARIARGVYVGFDAGQSRGIRIHNGVITDTFGTPSNSAGGDSIHIQQSDPADCVIENIKIVGWSWRAVKIQAPGVTVRNIDVHSDNSYSAEAVITTFFPTRIDWVTGHVAKQGHGVVINTTGRDGGEVVLKNFNLSLSGNNSNQTLKYLIRAYNDPVGRIDRLSLTNISIFGDENYNRLIDVRDVADEAEVHAVKLKSTATADSSIYANKATFTSGSFMSNGGAFIIYGADGVFSTNRFYSTVQIRSGGLNFSLNVIEHIGNNLLDIRAEASKCLISLNKVMGFSGNAPIIIRSGAAGNRLVHNDYSSNTASSPAISDLSAGANTIVDYV